MKLFLKAILLSALCLSLCPLFKKPFKLPPIYPHFPANLKWEMKAPSQEILSILEQPFSYLTKGNQSTVFVSEDELYVLKLFRYKRPIFPLVYTLKNGLKKIPRQTFLAKMEKTFDAAFLACTEGKTFTECVYCHLNLSKSDLPSLSLHVGDKSYKIPLDRYRFVLQKKANLLTKELLKARNHPEKVKQMLLSFLDLLEKREAKGIRNSDPNISSNFGFYKGRAIEIDFGNYQKTKKDLHREKENYLLRLLHWTEKNMPEYAQFVRDLQGKS